MRPCGLFDAGCWSTRRTISICQPSRTARRSGRCCVCRRSAPSRRWTVAAAAACPMAGIALRLSGRRRRSCSRGAAPDRWLTSDRAAAAKLGLLRAWLLCDVLLRCSVLVFCVFSSYWFSKFWVEGCPVRPEPEKSGADFPSVCCGMPQARALPLGTRELSSRSAQSNVLTQQRTQRGTLIRH